jgi:diacylglycerol kinase (ATP)
MKEKEPFSWRKRGKSFVYAFAGLRKLISEEHNARIHTVAALAAILLGFLFGISAHEWCIIVLCIGSVIAAEAFNSAIEALADKVETKHDALIGRAKDMAAGGVLITAIASATIGLIIFLPYLIALFH